MLLGGLAALSLVLAAVICVCSGAALWLAPVWFLGLYLLLLLLAFGFLAHPLILCALKLRHRWIQVGLSVGTVASYVGFLTI